MGTMRLLLIILVIYLVWQGLKRYIFPMLLQRAARKMQSAMEERMHENARRQAPPRQEGEVKIDYAPPKKKANQSSDEFGDYVDFEEVD